MNIQEAKLALAPLIRKDGVDIVVWRDNTIGTLYTLYARHNPTHGQDIEVMLDSEPNKWTQLAECGFALDAVPRGPYVSAPTLTVADANANVTVPREHDGPSRVEFYLQSHRYIIEPVPEIDVTLMVVAKRGHPQIKSFRRNILRAVVRLKKV